MKVSTKLYLGILLQFVIAVSVFIFIYEFQKKQDYDSVVINLAGRQRMLSQKMTKEMLLYSLGNIDVDKVNRSISVFDMTLSSLMNGGKAPLDLDESSYTDLPKPTSQKVINQIVIVYGIWKPFKDMAENFVATKDDESLNHIKNNNVNLLSEMNKAVFLMDQEAKSKVDLMRLALLLGAGTLIILFVVTLTVVRRNVQVIFKLLNNLTTGLGSVSKRTLEVSTNTSTLGQQLAEGVSEQAATLEETSSSLEEMSSMTKQNADNAGQADSLMREVNQVVTQANQTMTKLTSSMADITKASEETSKIIKAIDEIAFQTNLLALNAAVEAARAGEVGAGFAVVADEVRRLAMKAAEAARDTADLIEGTVQKVKDGSDLVTKTNDAFTQVAGSASKVGSLVSEISAASREQAVGIEQISKAVAEMDQVTQQNAANAELSSSASDETKALAERMKRFVSDLLALIGRGAESRKAAASAGPRSGRPRVDRPDHLPGRTRERKMTDSVEPREVRPEKLIPFEEGFQDF